MGAIDPIGWVERVLAMLVAHSAETIAAFFVLAFFYSQYSKDKSLKELNAAHAEKLEALNKAHYEASHLMRQELVALAKQLYEMRIPQRRRTPRRVDSLKAGGSE